MDLLCALPQQEYATAHENQIARRNWTPKERKQRLGRTNDPRQKQQERNAHEHGEKQAKFPGALASGRRQAIDKNGNKDDVIDAKHQLKRGQCKKRDP